MFVARLSLSGETRLPLEKNAVIPHIIVYLSLDRFSYCPLSDKRGRFARRVIKGNGP